MGKKFFIILLLILLIPFRALAQDSVIFSSVNVALWPEFDRPEMLVIYRLTLANSVSLPAEITLRIPARAGVPNAVAGKQVDGNLTNIAFEQQAQGDWSLLQFTATTPEIQIEYYDPNLIKQGNARHFDYIWPSDFEVTQMVVQVQQPFDATSMIISPSLGSGTTGQDGLIYYLAEVGSLSDDQSFTISLDYTKPSDELSSTGLVVQPSEPLEDTIIPGADTQMLLIYILGALGLLLIFGGVYWYWSTGKRQQPVARQRPRHKPASERYIAAEKGEHIYCHQCGNRANPGDRFCRVCGTQLRSG